MEWWLLGGDTPADLPPNQSNQLNDVACASASDCWAVGASGPELIERWNGSSWSLAALPNNGTPGNNLNGVTCVSPTDCWAVGTRVAGSQLQTLVEHWNGAVWSIVPSPNTSAMEHNTLARVTCTSSADCWAVGHTGLERGTLVEHWDGVAWTIVPAVNPDIARNVFFDVACTSATECWATGQFHDGNGYTPLFERWDGTSWTFVNTPHLFNAASVGLACVSPSDCWAVGYTEDGDSALVEHWNGNSWSVSSPPQGVGLNDIACVSAADCWAVDSRAQTEHWDGASWTVVATPPTPTSIVSRKVHGSAGTFEIDLPTLGPSGVECRRGGATGDYELVITFPNPVAVSGNPQAEVSSGVGLIGVGGAGNGGAVAVNENIVHIPMTNVADRQRIVVALRTVSDEAHTGDLVMTMKMLVGDINGNSSINATDVAQAKAQSGAIVTATNFRVDVNSSGTITASDIGEVKVNAGHILP